MKSINSVHDLENHLVTSNSGLFPILAEKEL